MRAFTTHTGTSVFIDRANIDTDQIIPKQFLKRIERSGYGEFLFYDWRFNSDGTLKPDFVLNDPKVRDASILIAGANFGCGSSREHAPWSLYDYGFRCVIAQSFADIFYNNSLKNGLLPVMLDERSVVELASRSTSVDHSISIDLEKQTVTDTNGFIATFEIDEFRKYCLINGLDDIGLTLLTEDKITNYEIGRGMSSPSK
jgi:3-isopropylmalate/(R)-2-methylmalate dehydratase small subunit